MAEFKQNEHFYNKDNVNPCPPEWLDLEDNEVLRGDAIGDTAYSHRWILSSLLTITQALPKYFRSAIKSTVTTLDQENSSGFEVEENGSNKQAIAEQDRENHDEPPILELEEEVEIAACQLWDMTVEKDVALHLLALKEIDLLQMCSLIFDECCAPRLTEVMVGVTGNLCCLKEGCEKVLMTNDNEVLLSVLRLLGSTRDARTLSEVMRLIRLLLWYRIYRTPETAMASCPLIQLLCEEYYVNRFTFFLNNSLSVQFLEILSGVLVDILSICLPETAFSVASFYSTNEFISSIIDLLEKHSHTGDDEDGSRIKSNAIVCLYHFIDTPGAKIIGSLASNTPNFKLEHLLNGFIEDVARVESLEELQVDGCYQISRAVRLSQLLVPFMRQPTLLMTIGKILAYFHGETRQYSVSRTSSTEERKRNRSSDESNETDYLLLSEATMERIRKESMGDSLCQERLTGLKTQTSNPSVEEEGWMSPPPLNAGCSEQGNSSGVEPSDIQGIKEDELAKCPKPATDHSEASTFTDDKDISDETNDRKNNPEELHESLNNLRETLEEYCYQLLSFWWSLCPQVEERQREAQKIILNVLDQCHAHEVLFILKAVRLRDQSLVPRLQEQILDSGSHERLVILLAHMYQ